MKQTPLEHPPEIRGVAENGNAQHRALGDLKAYLDGELSGLSRWLTARHVARCASCRAEMRRMEHLSRQVQNLDQASPASHLRARILASLPAAPPANAPAMSRFQSTNVRSFAALSRRPLSAAAGLCALLLMVGAFALARYGRAGATGGDTGFTNGHGVTSGPRLVNVTPNAALARSAQGLALSPAPPMPPAPTQPDPFAPDTIAQAGGREGAGADTSTSQHSTSANTDDTNSEGSSQSAATEQAAYTDPTSAAADRIAATIIPDKLREKRQAGAAQTSTSIHPSIPTSVPVSKMPASAPMQMAVAVADVSEASRQVRRWAEEAGAQVTAMPSKTIRTAAGLQSSNETSDAVHNAYDPHTGTSGSSADTASALPVPQTATLLRLQVPVQRAAGFEAYLSRMAKAAGAAAHTKGEEINAVHESRTDAIATRPYPMSAHVLDAEPVAPRKHPATVTIIVRLQPGNSAPHP